jgi:hypothetical protein
MSSPPDRATVATIAIIACFGHVAPPLSRNSSRSTETTILPRRFAAPKLPRRMMIATVRKGDLQQAIEAYLGAPSMSEQSKRSRY